MVSSGSANGIEEFSDEPGIGKPLLCPEIFASSILFLGVSVLDFQPVLHHKRLVVIVVLLRHRNDHVAADQESYVANTDLSILLSFRARCQRRHEEVCWNSGQCNFRLLAWSSPGYRGHKVGLRLDFQNLSAGLWVYSNIRPILVPADSERQLSISRTADMTSLPYFRRRNISIIGSKCLSNRRIRDQVSVYFCLSCSSVGYEKLIYFADVDFVIHSIPSPSSLAYASEQLADFSVGMRHVSHRFTLGHISAIQLVGYGNYIAIQHSLVASETCSSFDERKDHRLHRMTAVPETQTHRSPNPLRRSGIGIVSPDGLVDDFDRFVDGAIQSSLRDLKLAYAFILAFSDAVQSFGQCADLFVVRRIDSIRLVVRHDDCKLFQVWLVAEFGGRYLVKGLRGLAMMLQS